MTHEPVHQPTPGPRRPRGEPARRRPLREQLTPPRLTPPKFSAPTRRALGWTGGILVLIAVAVAILIAVWDWNWFRGPLERYASARTHRTVEITGDLDANLWSWQPSATVDGVRIGNPKWAGTDRLGSIDRIAVKIRLIPLLWGDVDLRLLSLDKPNFDLLADGQGRKNWDFSDGRVQEPMQLPPIRQFIIKEGRLTYVDRRRDVVFEGAINAREELGGQNRGFELTGRGTINRAPFRAEVTGGPLLNIERDKPYPFNAELRSGRTFVTAHGAVPKPFDLGRFHMDTTARGQDLADLFPITGVALPNTPPYNLKGRIVRDELVWRIDGLGGRVGDSDLSGHVKVETGRDRPMLTADLRSRSLDFDDLGALFGAAPKTGPGETASPEQVVLAKQLRAQQRLLPDAPLDLKRIRAMDADVKFVAASIRDAPAQLRSGSVRVRLDDGMLRANPVQANLPRGRIDGYINLDARKATPVTDLDLRLSNARIEQVLPIDVGGSAPLSGALVGRAKLRGQGISVRRTLGAADGQVVLVAPGGEIRKAFAELMGVNVVKGLGLLMSKDTSTTPIRCGVARFETRGGVMRADNIVFDTGPVLVTGKGTVNLATERMDFRLRGHDKKFRLVRALLPVTATGPIVAPKLGVEPGAAIAQGGVAAALGTLLTPLAAILPFIDPGLAKDANCGALLAEAGRQGAPVRTAKPLTAKR